MEEKKIIQYKCQHDEWHDTKEEACACNLLSRMKELIDAKKFRISGSTAFEQIIYSGVIAMAIVHNTGQMENLIQSYKDDLEPVRPKANSFD